MVIKSTEVESAEIGEALGLSIQFWNLELKETMVETAEINSALFTRGCVEFITLRMFTGRFQKPGHTIYQMLSPVWF